MKLYYFETPNPRKACAVARYLEAPVEFVRVDLMKAEQRTEAFRALNPNGKVPVLVDGDTVIWEATAIMVHLARKAGSDLWPEDARQVEVVRWLAWDMSHFSRHAGSLLFENHIRALVGMGETNGQAVAEATGFFRQFAAVLDGHLKGRSHLVGDALTLADFAVASFLPTAAEAKLPLAEFPEIRRWHAALESLPAWRNPFPAAAKAA
jgi:glutathione S-transferase